MKEVEIITRRQTDKQGLYSSSLWEKDLDLALSAFPEAENFAGNTVLVTGATGLICSAIIDLLLHYNETHTVPIKIAAAGRSLQKIKERFAPFYAEPYFTYVPYDATVDDNKLVIKADYIIHGAGNAHPRVKMEESVETMQGNFNGVLHLLQLAKRQGSRRLLYISSSEVYGRKDDRLSFKEGQYGYVDILDPRSSYAMAKRAAETLCISYAFEYGVDVVIVRPGHIYGPTATPQDTRVASAWAYAAAKGNDIVMKSNGAQMRSYCYCLDCATALLKVLLRGKAGQAYNISNSASVITVEQMAWLLAQAGHVNLVRREATAQEQAAFNPMNDSSLDGTALENLGWQGLFSAYVGFSHTVAILRDVLARSEGRI